MIIDSSDFSALHQLAPSTGWIAVCWEGMGTFSPYLSKCVSLHQVSAHSPQPTPTPSTCRIRIRWNDE